MITGLILKTASTALARISHCSVSLHPLLIHSHEDGHVDVDVVVADFPSEQLR